MRKTWKIGLYSFLLMMLISLGIANVGWSEDQGVKQKYGSNFFLNNFYGSAVTDSHVPCLWLVGNFGSIWVSEDYGKTWQVRVSGGGAELFDISFANSKDGWIVGRFGVILKTDDGGKSWSKQNSQTEQTLFSVFFVDSNRGWAVGDYGLILHTVDGGETWTKQGDEVDIVYNRVLFADENHGWVVGEKGLILYTRDGGANWVKQVNPLGEVTLFGLYVFDRFKAVACGMDGRFLMTGDGGEIWEEISTSTDESLLNVMMSGDKGWAVGLKGTLITTSDAGKSWEISPSSPPSFSWFDICIFLDDVHGLVAGGNGSIFFTADAGKTWQMPEEVVIPLELRD